MKNLFITILLLLTTFISKAQEQFEGVWAKEGSVYETIIMASEYAVMDVFNYSFESDKVIKETILLQTNNTLVTKLYNPSNGYSVQMEYFFKNKKTLHCKITGHLNTEVALEKIN